MDFETAIDDLPLFQHLTPSEVRQLLPSTEIRTFNDGEYIIREGDESDYLCIVLSGGASVIKNERRVAVNPPGRVVGEMGLFGYLPRTASVAATGRTTVMIIRRETLFNVFDSEPRLSVRFLFGILQEVIVKLARTG